MSAFCFCYSSRTSVRSHTAVESHIFALFVVQDAVTPDVLNHVTYEAHENAYFKAKKLRRFIAPIF